MTNKGLEELALFHNLMEFMGYKLRTVRKMSETEETDYFEKIEEEKENEPK